MWEGIGALAPLSDIAVAGALFAYQEVLLIERQQQIRILMVIIGEYKKGGKYYVCTCDDSLCFDKQGR